MLLLRLSASILYALLIALTFIWGALVFDIEIISAPVTEFMSEIVDNIYVKLTENSLQESSVADLTE
ncbi:hypothetical protein M977_04515 [Buttiauxella gaviniae ATCC 51604]|uniref:Uncharacterized protein n=1 Tax=Buttiauxella gaviniae ATCC 51604 TaxID=1354253 RepID=A0A1B7HMB7_9ENTR|nr:hypothetical protein [Buttiauxella gaviniae]OAT16765.1 hypothetical protein M977_04515 [Buttiauxella gaviniae ATCC 51604]